MHYRVLVRKPEGKNILKGSDDGVSHSELLGFWTFSIAQYSSN
jgi:hypothetical protein